MKKVRQIEEVTCYPCAWCEEWPCLYGHDEEAGHE